MRNAILLPMVLGLGACVPMQPAVPQAARLTQTELIVTLSDATICRAPSGPAGASGRFDRCGPGYAYQVELVSRPNLLRQMAEAAFGALGADDQLSPMGRVTLTDAAGTQFAFVSPVPVPLD
jgi:hypothetical protein